MIRTTEIRPATPADVPEIVAMVHELAEYERAAAECHLTEAQLTTALFEEAPTLFAHVAEVVDETGDGSEARSEAAAAGCALWFRNFSTWRGVFGIYLEDLFVRPRFRGLGLGRALLASLAAECVERGYARLEWAVLDWNEPAIGFYRSLGAVPSVEWTTFRLTGTALADLGVTNRPSSPPAPTTGPVH